MGRETEFGLTFVGATYYDGQGFMVPRALRINSALQLDGAKVCVQSGTTTELNLADFFRISPWDPDDLRLPLLQFIIDYLKGRTSDHGKRIKWAFWER